MFQFLTNRLLDHIISKERARIPKLNPSSVHSAIHQEIKPGASLYLESRDRTFTPWNPSDPDNHASDIVSLIVTWSRDGVLPWNTEQPAKDLQDKLAYHPNIEAMLLLSRDPDSFVGYYVQIRFKSPQTAQS